MFKAIGGGVRRRVLGLVAAGRLRKKTIGPVCNSFVECKWLGEAEPFRAGQ